MPVGVCDYIESVQILFVVAIITEWLVKGVLLALRLRRRENSWGVADNFVNDRIELFTTFHLFIT